ncbi:MAG: UPF0179 family protein [Candidatus Nezhaarchaeota archaeon]|nr:UPF0179 family protein [Candidatus Nezhaarchaeota archaeon]
MKEIITTLVGRLQAKPGFKFVFEKPADVCFECKLREVCALKLKPNTVYVVVDVVGKKHECALRGDWVVVARVAEAEVEAMIDAKMAIEDAIITLKKARCTDVTCKYYVTCQSPYIREGKRYKVLRVTSEGKVCEGRKLVKALLMRVNEAT